MPRSLRSSAGTAMTGALLGGLLLVVAALLFVGVYLVLPQDDHFYALITIGILSLLFALGSYLGSALTREPGAARLATFGFLGMGFATLLLTLILAPANPLTLIAQLIGLVLVVLVLIAVVAFARWRASSLGREAQRRERRQEWSSAPAPSAFSYAAAQKSEAPPPQAPPSGGGSPTRPGGAP
jgi:O-antigen/teichoic acid export membrane protein